MRLFRKHWHDPRFWQWWWRHRVSSDLKVVPALTLVAAVAVGGYFAAGGLGGLFGSGSEVEIYETTVHSVRTVRADGRIVRREVPVVQRVLVTTTTSADGAQVVTRRIVSTVPIVRREVVTLKDAPRTVVETRPGGVVTRTRTEVVPGAGRTVTDERVVTTERVVTVVQPVTQTVPVTVTAVRTDTVTVPLFTITTITITSPFP